MGVITQFSGKVLWKVDFLVFRPHPFLCLEVVCKMAPVNRFVAIGP